MPRTKIIATVGPASSSEQMLKKMFSGGLDVVRLNFSHGSLPEHIQKIKTIQTLNKKAGFTVKIMQDLEGYRIRIGVLSRPLPLEKGSEFYLTQEKSTASPKEVYFDYRGPLEVIPKGVSVYVDDGKIVLKVLSVKKRRLKVKVMVPGMLKGNKGINIPEAGLRFGSLTEKDRQDIAAVERYRPDYIAQSFVRGAADIKVIKDMVKPGNPQCRIFAKIENRQALANLEEIIEESDGIIVARGDLGICLPIQKVPVLQKEIVKRCVLRNKEVAVATQMLESMINNDLPTRAEASDVANAILDGANYLLLSAETAIGSHPDKVVKMMDDLIVATEDYQRKLQDLLR